MDEEQYQMHTDDYFIYPDSDDPSFPFDPGPIVDFSSNGGENNEQSVHNKTKTSNSISNQMQSNALNHSFEGNLALTFMVGSCQNQKKSDVTKFIEKEVLVGQKKKFTKQDKIVVFTIITDFILEHYPNYACCPLFNKLKRKQKRELANLEVRFQQLGPFIYNILQSPLKKELSLKILQEINEMEISKLKIEISKTQDIKLISKKQNLIVEYKNELAEINKQFGL